MINDEYGNFIIQQIFNFGISDMNKEIFDFIAKDFIHFSKQKFSSNIIDKCFLSTNSHLKEDTIDLILKTKAVSLLIVDPYGNYSKSI